MLRLRKEKNNIKELVVIICGEIYLSNFEFHKRYEENKFITSV